MKAYLLTVCVLFAIQHISGEKLNIEILYESLCPDSVNFVSNQLTPTYNEISQYVNITFVPFGNAYSTNDGFVCQHGPKECQGNRAQSCVLSFLQEQEKQIKYVNCFMTSYFKNPGEHGQECAEQVGVHWENVKQCFASKMGTMLQLHAEQLTNNYSPAFIPTIVYDNVFDQEAQDNSIYGFRQYVCSRLQKNNPSACPAVQLEPLQ